MSLPKDLLYTKTHEWVEIIDGNLARVGITDYAQEELGDIVYVNLPEKGQEIEKGEVLADIESVKTAEDVYSPVSGSIVDINEELIDSPEAINENAFDAWFVEVSLCADTEDLMTAEEYEQYIEEE